MKIKRKEKGRKNENKNSKHYSIDLADLLRLHNYLAGLIIQEKWKYILCYYIKIAIILIAILLLK